MVTSYLSFRLSARMSARPNRRFYVKFDIGYFYENYFRKSNFLSSDKNIGKFTWRRKYASTSICFENPSVHPQEVSVASAMNSPRKHYCALLNISILPTAIYCTTPQHTEGALLPLQYNSYTQKPQCYDIRTPLIFCDMPSGRHRMGRNMGNRNCMLSCSTDYLAKF